MVIQRLKTRPLIPFLALFLLCAALLVNACAPTEPSRWDTAQETSTGQRATAKEAVAGGEFNKFFPASNDEYDVVYTQEKSGFAEAVLKHGGEDVATLAIFDTASNPEAAEKYAASSKEIEGYPALAIGNTGLGILVAERFQVQVRSKTDAFTADDRETWLGEFDLSGLAGLK